MKARPVAGDLNFGWQAIRAMDPIIYTVVDGPRRGRGDPRDEGPD